MLRGQSGGIGPTALRNALLNLGDPPGFFSESQFTRALIWAPPPRQINAVKDISSNMSDAQYLGNATDADIYDSYLSYTPAAGTKPSGVFLGTGYTNSGNRATPGTLTSTNAKALALYAQKCQWDLSLKQSLVVQQEFFIPDNGTANTMVSTNLWGCMPANGASQGVYANVSAAGAITVGVKCGIAALQASNMTPTGVVLVPNTLYRMTTVISANGLNATEPPTISVWLNGEQSTANPAVAINPDANGSYSTFNAVTAGGFGANFGIGCATDDAVTANFTASKLFTSRFRVVVLPYAPKDSGAIDLLFNQNPGAFLRDYDLFGLPL